MIKVEIVYEKAKCHGDEEVPHYVSISVLGHATEFGESVDSFENHDVSSRLCASISLACQSVYAYASLYPHVAVDIGRGKFDYHYTGVVADNTLDARIDTLVWILNTAHANWPNHFSSFAMIERKNAKHGKQN